MLFNALTDGDILAANYPFATIEPTLGVAGKAGRIYIISLPINK